MALDNQRILLIEQGTGKDKTMINKIYLVDLAQASDLSAFDGQGKALEFDDAKDLAKRGVKLAQKRKWRICASWAGARRKRKGWR